MSEAKKVLTQKQVTEEYGWSRKKQWQRRKEGKLGYIWDNGRIAYLLEHIEAYLRSCERPAK